MCVARVWALLGMSVANGYSLSLSSHLLRPASSTRCSTACASFEPNDADLNWLHTQLHRALDAEDYLKAAQLRDSIRHRAGVSDEASWIRLGVPDWLADRLERLNYPLPTRVQLHALRATEAGDDAAVCAPTGSGKTLAYLLPLLAQLSDDLLSEDLAEYLGSAIDGGRLARASARSRALRRAAIDSAAANEETAAQSGFEVPTPAMLVVVPTRELGVQVSMVCYRLLGGGTTNPTLQPYNHPSRFQPGGKANMFSYKGPRHVKVAGLWDEQSLFAAAYQDMLKGVHIIVGTPQYLSRVAVGGNLRLQHVRAIVVDEADACLIEQADEMSHFMRRMAEVREANRVPPPQTLLAGASLSPPLVRRAVEKGWLRWPAVVSENGWTDVALEAVESTLVAEQRVPAGARHEYIVAEPRQEIATLCRLLRDRFEAVNSETEPPRVIVFAPSAEEAVALASRLQGALFGTVTGDAAAGLWGLSVLLPSAESRLETTVDDDTQQLSVLESSLRVMEMFACNRTSVLVTTAAATRGLDFPQVTDVLNLGIVGSPADYVHRAGRVGRVGQTERGSVVSVLCPAEVEDLLALGRTLHFLPRERPPPQPRPLASVFRDAGIDGEMPAAAGEPNEQAVQALSDIFNLLDTDEPPHGA